MKLQLSLLTLFSALLMSACNPSSSAPEHGTYPDTACFATLSIEEEIEDSTEEKYILTTDKGIRLFMVDNKVTGKFEHEDGDRLVIYFAVIEDYSKKESDGDDTVLEGSLYNCKYGIRLFDVTRVQVAENIVVETEEDSDKYNDHALSYLYDSIKYSDGYINMMAGLRADDINKVKLYLVENNSTDPAQSAEGYLNLELRYDRGSNEAVGSTYNEYVSLDVSDYADRLSDMKGVLLRIVTSKSGTIHIKIDIEIKESDENTLRKVSPTTNVF